jgi:hypothetical protein
MKRAEIKPGRTVSKIGMFGGIAGILFGILWIGLALHLSSQDEDTTPVIFLSLFGVVFIIASIAILVFYAKSAYGKGQDRPSLVDVEEAPEDEVGAKVAADDQAGPKQEFHYCPYCGKAINNDSIYCQHCGKKMP